MGIACTRATTQTVSRSRVEKHVQVDGKFADAVLRDFRTGEREKFLIAVEGKKAQESA